MTPTTHLSRAPAPVSDEPERPTETADWLDRRIFHPLAGRLAHALQPTGVTPNAVSLSGVVLLAAAGLAYLTDRGAVSITAGFLLQFLAGVVDGADGDLARLTGKTSPTGELVDGVCDYVGQVLLYFSLIALLAHQIGFFWAVAAAAVAGASHAVQMNHAESQKRFYLWWAYRIPWLKNAQAAGDAVFQRRTWFSFGFGWMATDYIRLARRMTPYAFRVDAAIAAGGEDPERLARIGALAKDRLRGALEYQKLLAANSRWILVAIAMMLGSPLWYFLAEITLMNLLLLASVGVHNRQERTLAASIAALG